MTRAEVECGGWGFRIVVTARGQAGGSVSLEVEGECPAVHRFIEEMGDIDPYAEGGKFSTSSVYRAADRALRHVDCAVPAAVIRAVNVESALALPHQVQMRIVRE